MLRKLAIAIAASGAMMSAVNVHALGMGDIELDSALNQPLDARIKLLKASELEDWEMKPNLASPDEFEKSGVEYVFFLNNLKFEVVREAEGVFVQVSTNEAVVEPFLNFVVQVDWPNGRLLREYTLLLDPPVFTEEEVEPVAPAHSQFEESLPEETNLPGVAPAAVTQSPTQPETKFTPTEPVETKPASEYKVRANDTLWEVAIKTRPNRTISPQQAMLAIQDLNPDAFIAGNINRLKKNQILRVPSEDQMLSRSFDQAVSEVALQNQALVKRKAQLDATRKDVATERNDQVDGTRLKLLAGGEATTESERGASGQVGTKTAGDQSKLEKELSITLENLDKSTRENQELRTRLDALEDQINTLQRLINLKDEQMVALQSGMAEKPAAKDSIAPSESKPESTPTPDSGDLNFAPPTDKASIDKPESATAPAEKVTAGKPAPVKPKAIIPPVVPVEETFDPVAFVMENPPILGAGLGVLLLALLGLNYSRKRKEKQQDAEEQSTNAMMSDAIDDVDLSDELESDLQNTEDANAESEFDLDDDLTADTGENTTANAAPQLSPEDVMGEVDVYLAYNRLEPARDLLQKSLAANPEHEEYRRKLIEVLTEMGEEEEANQLRHHSEEDITTSESLNHEEVLEEVNEDFAMDFDLDDDDNNLDPELDTSEVASDDLLEESTDLDFDLDGLEFKSDSSDLENDLSLDSDLDLDFELNTDSSNSEADELSDLNDSLTDELEDLGLDFDGSEADGLDEIQLDLDDDSNNDLGSTQVEETEFEQDLDLPTLDSVASSEDDGIEFDLGEFDTLSEDSDEGLEFDSLEQEEAPTLDLDEEATVSNEGVPELTSSDDDLGDLEFDIEESIDDENLDIELSAEELDSIPELQSEAESEFSNVDNELDGLSFELDEQADEELSIDMQSDPSVDEVESASVELDENEASEDIQLEEEQSEESLPDFEEGLTLDEEIELPELTDEIDNGLDSELSELTDSDIELPTLDAEIDDLELPDLDDDFDISVSEDETLESTDAVAQEYKEELPTLDDSADDSLITALDATSTEGDFPPLGNLDDLDLDNLDSDLDFLSGTDESETKLDLARAYIDMEDQEGAKEILQEVLEEGSDQQKEEANKLLDSMV